MSIQTIADQTIAEIRKKIAGKLSKDDFDEMAQIIQSALMRLESNMPESCPHLIVLQSGPDADKAHKTAEDLQCKLFALEANLSSQR